MKADWPTTTPLSGPSEQCLPYTIVRHPIDSEWFINPGLRRSIEAGELTGSSAGRGMNAALRADLAEAAAVVPTGQINLAEATTSLVAVGRLTSWHRSSPTSRAERSPHREVDEDEGIMTMIGCRPGRHLRTPD